MTPSELSELGHNLEHHLWSSFRLLQVSIMLLENIYSTSANHNDLQKTIKKFYSTGHRSLSYKTFYGRNLQMFRIRLCVCPWQAFIA